MWSEAFSQQVGTNGSGSNGKNLPFFGIIEGISQ